jgi:asparagine synthase (glutamine-hydrolysing)
VSRDITLVQKIINTPIKNLNLAEFFVFDYNLCDRSIFESIYQLQLFENLELNLKSGEFTAFEKKLRYNFHESEIKYLTDELLDNMVNKFLKACKNRGGEKNVLSLSGVMGSRSVAAGLKKIGMPVEGVTFQDEDKPAVNDVKLAEEIASSLGIKWSKILLTTNSFLNDLEEIIEFKLGIQPARFYYLFQYCKKVYELYGNRIVFWTGDGGDKVFPELTHGITFDQNQRLFNYIIKENYEFSIPEAAQLTGVSKKDLINQIWTTITSYPGKNSGDKLQYFYLSGRMKRYIFEGEDRNRNFFWSTNPFLSKQFFELIMKIHPSIKKDNHFYTKFIGKLDQKTANIRNENFSKGNIQLNRDLYRFFKNQANSLLSRKSKEYIKSLFKGGGRPNKAIREFKNEILNFEEGGQPINMKLVKSKFSNYSSAQLSLILTALKVNEKISQAPKYV